MKQGRRDGRAAAGAGTARHLASRTNAVQIGVSTFTNRTWAGVCVQWVAAHPLSRIVVVVFVVILSVVVVVCRLGPSSSTFAPSLGVGTLHELDEH